MAGGCPRCMQAPASEVAQAGRSAAAGVSRKSRSRLVRCCCPWMRSTRDASLEVGVAASHIDCLWRKGSQLRADSANTGAVRHI